MSGCSELKQQLSALAETIEAATAQRRIEFEWMMSHHGLATKHDIERLEKLITITQAQLKQALNNQTTQIGKIAKEQSDRFDALTKTIADLNAVIQAGGEVTPEVTAALATTQAALDSLDAAIPDAPA